MRRLDRLVSVLFYHPITTAAMRLAAESWSRVRRAGMPQALDADCILAAQAALLGDPGDDIVIATTNVGHLGRFPRVRAESWEMIVSYVVTQDRGATRDRQTFRVELLPGDARRRCRNVR